MFKDAWCCWKLALRLCSCSALFSTAGWQWRPLSKKASSGKLQVVCKDDNASFLIFEKGWHPVENQPKLVLHYAYMTGSIAAAVLCFQKLHIRETALSQSQFCEITGHVQRRLCIIFDGRQWHRETKTTTTIFCFFKMHSCRSSFF